MVLTIYKSLCECLNLCVFDPCFFSGGKGPLVQEHLSDAFARLGATAEFECRIAGEPTPDITWSDFLKLYSNILRA